MTITRREMCILLPGLLPAAAALDAFGEPDNALPSANYPFDKLAVQILDHAEMRRVLRGKLATGEALEVHETMLSAGSAPHAPHHHVHSEMWFIREGTVGLRSTAPATVWVQAEWGSFIRTMSMESRMSARLPPAISSWQSDRVQTPDASIRHLAQPTKV